MIRCKNNSLTGKEVTLSELGRGRNAKSLVYRFRINSLPKVEADIVSYGIDQNGHRMVLCFVEEVDVPNPKRFVCGFSYEEERRVESHLREEDYVNSLEAMRTNAEEWKFLSSQTCWEFEFEKQYFLLADIVRDVFSEEEFHPSVEVDIGEVMHTIKVEHQPFGYRCIFRVQVIGGEATLMLADKELSAERATDFDVDRIRQTLGDEYINRVISEIQRKKDSSGKIFKLEEDILNASAIQGERVESLSFKIKVSYEEKEDDIFFGIDRHRNLLQISGCMTDDLARDYGLEENFSRLKAYAKKRLEDEAMRLGYFA